MAADLIARLTAAEYLERESAAAFPSEFYAGEVIAMAGGSARHMAIVNNLIRESGNRLKGTGCRAFAGECLLEVSAERMYAYPDLMIFCGPVGTAPNRDDIVVNPRVLVEVLSPSTERFDRGRKAFEYRKIATLEQYVLISQDEALVEIYSRRGAAWELREVAGLEAEMPLESVGIRLPMGDIYDGVSLDAAGLAG